MLSSNVSIQTNLISIFIFNFIRIIWYFISGGRKLFHLFKRLFINSIQCSRNLCMFITIINAHIHK